MNRLEKNQKIIWLLKALLFSYVVTGISLLLLSDFVDTNLNGMSILFRQQLWQYMYYQRL